VDKDARPFRNVSSDFGLADGMRLTSIRSPQPQGQESIAPLVFARFPHDEEPVTEHVWKFLHRRDQLEMELIGPL
jgi:hypothetical protein